MKTEDLRKKLAERHGTSKLKRHTRGDLAGGWSYYSASARCWLFAGWTPDLETQFAAEAEQQQEGL
jgi:hypothetical protein